VTTGSGPCAIAEFDEAVWVTNLTANNIMRIDGATNEVGDPVDVGLGPCAIANDGEALWIGILSERALVRFDPETEQVTDRLDVSGPVWDIQVGHGSVWVSVQQAQTLLRIDPDTKEVEETFDVGAQPSGLAITETEVWLATTGGTIMRWDPETNERLPDIVVDGDPSWFASAPGSVVLTMSTAGRVTVVDTIAATPTSDFELQRQPRDPGYVGDNFWVTAGAPNRVAVVDPESGDVVGEFAVPDSLGIWTAEGLLGDGWVLDFSGRDVFRYGADSGI
jgi:DNA-binding beta-propeller fold protein YncE